MSSTNSTSFGCAAAAGLGTGEAGTGSS
jgi:hypothetical protein